MKVIKKPEELDAIQYNGTNDDEILAFVAETPFRVRLLNSKGEVKETPVADNKLASFSPLSVGIGSWIIKGESGVTVAPDASFRGRFDEVRRP